MSSIDCFLPFIARACLVLLFPFSALDKIFDFGNAVAQAAASGVPAPGWLPLLLGGCPSHHSTWALRDPDRT